MQIASWPHGGKRVFCRLRSKHSIPDCRRSFTFAAQPPEGELTLVDTTKQFNAGDCGSGGCEVLEAEHGPSPALDAAVILFNHVVQVLGAAQLYTPGQQAVLLHLPDCSMRGGIAVQCDGVRPSPRMAAPS